MKLIGNEEAWCNECGTSAKVYPGRFEVQHSDKWLAQAHCYQHGNTTEYA